MPGDTVSPHDDPTTYLYSDSHGVEEVKRVTVEDKGSHLRYAEVLVQGVFLQGVVDTGSDLTIMGKEAFKQSCHCCQAEEAGFSSCRQEGL